MFMNVYVNGCGCGFALHSLFIGAFDQVLVSEMSMVNVFLVKDGRCWHRTIQSSLFILS